jgi:hypothetical protein
MSFYAMCADKHLTACCMIQEDLVHVVYVGVFLIGRYFGLPENSALALKRVAIVRYVLFLIVLCAFFWLL